MAFNALSLTRFPEIQDQHLEFFPLALWALDRLLTTPRVAYAVHLAGWFVLQALTCGYLLCVHVAFSRRSRARQAGGLDRIALSPRAGAAAAVGGRRRVWRSRRFCCRICA